MSQSWYVQTPKGKAGPCSSAVLRGLAESGKITPQSLIRRDGEKWVPASRVKGLTFAGATPAEKPSPPPSDPAGDDEYGLVAVEPRVETPPHPSAVADAIGQVARLDRDLEAKEPELPPPSSVAALPMRFGVSFGLGATAAAGTAALVKLVRFFGWIDLDTTASSLIARVGLPAVAFVLTFALIFWVSGQETSEAEITAEMSDEEIARALNRY